MSLNLGTPAVEAARALHASNDWRTILAALYEASRVKMNNALESQPDGVRHDAVGYARALRDVWVALESATLAVPPARVVKPGPEKPRGV